uniref:Pathogenesis-related homeodomain protein n=1 Tax=Anthurium amnicola TaxID=1678845 RepID=A0A1D1YNF0_9ARAE
MQMIRKRSARYTPKKSSFCKWESRSNLNSSVLKNDGHNISSSKGGMPRLKSSIKKARARKNIINERGRAIEKNSIRSWRSLKSAGEESPPLCHGRSVIHADGDGGLRRTGKRRRKRKKKTTVLDEASRLQRRTRYLLIRMKLEQNLIDAYSAEGWKGQSREKIKPEKELQRARKQILNCKLGIRDAIHQLELLSSEGCIEESMISPDGSVHHEHIFCAKCKSREAFPDNDIVLCDGTCNCAFHQKCLEPPLAKVPPGDQGWLCKFCECKVEILEAVNAHLGTCFSVNSGWEDIFKEAATGLDGGNPYLDPAQEWPSEDSQDDDYNPEIKEKSNSMMSIEDNIPDDASSFSSLCCSSDEATSGSKQPLNDDKDGGRSHIRPICWKGVTSLIL